MPDLIAQGADPRHRWRRTLIPHIPIVLGRAGGGWDVPWDSQISRRHAQLLWNSEFLQVTRLEAGTQSGVLPRAGSSMRFPSARASIS